MTPLWAIKALARSCGCTVLSARPKLTREQQEDQDDQLRADYVANLGSAA